MLRPAFGLAAVLASSTALLADELKISPDATLRYLSEQYRQYAREPRQSFDLKYNPPYLQVIWQTGIPGTGSDSSPIQQATIDLRYAKFDSWNDGRRDWDVIIIDCVKYYPCFQDDVRHFRFGHGEISYFLLGYASGSIANAFNHLASFSAKARPKNPFD